MVLTLTACSRTFTGLGRPLADAASSLEYGVAFRRERKGRGSRSDGKQEGSVFALVKHQIDIAEYSWRV